MIRRRMKITYHQVTQTAQESLRVIELRGPTYKCTWHFHPEFQIGLVVKGSGHRIVGDNIASFNRAFRRVKKANPSSFRKQLEAMN